MFIVHLACSDYEPNVQEMGDYLTLVTMRELSGYPLVLQMIVTQCKLPNLYSLPKRTTTTGPSERGILRTGL